MGDDVIVMSFTFSPYNCPYLKFYWTYKLLGTNTQQHNINLITKNESDLDGRLRSQAKVKGHKKWTNSHISQAITLTDIKPGTKIQYNKQHLIT